MPKKNYLNYFFYTNVETLLINSQNNKCSSGATLLSILIFVIAYHSLQAIHIQNDFCSDRKNSRLMLNCGLKSRKYSLSDELATQENHNVVLLSIFTIVSNLSLILVSSGIIIINHNFFKYFIASVNVGYFILSVYIYILLSVK